MLPRRVKGGWVIGGFEYEENPRFTTPGWATRMVQRWAELRRLSGGQGLPGSGVALFPRPGGYLDQPAALMDAWGMFDAWLAQKRSGGEVDDA